MFLFIFWLQIDEIPTSANLRNTAVHEERAELVMYSYLQCTSSGLSWSCTRTYSEPRAGRAGRVLVPAVHEQRAGLVTHVVTDLASVLQHRRLAGHVMLRPAVELEVLDDAMRRRRVNADVERSHDEVGEDVALAQPHVDAAVATMLVVPVLLALLLWPFN